jgi:RNA polymerase sigma-70 factor (ECF subfamily)
LEQELIASLKSDDQKALKKLFELYHASLCSLAYTLTKDKDQSKDVVQDVFIKLWKNRQSLEITVSLYAYLKRATVNTAINYIEKTGRSNKQPIEKSDLTAYAQNTTDQDFSYNELKNKADEAICQLPSRTRAVFTLIRAEEMSYKEVADTLDISLKAVEKEMLKALKLLREALREYLPSSMILLAANIFL